MRREILILVAALALFSLAIFMQNPLLSTIRQPMVKTEFTQKDSANADGEVYQIDLINTTIERGIPLRDLAICRVPNTYLGCKPPHERCEDGCVPLDTIKGRVHTEQTKFSFSEATKVVDRYFKLQPERLKKLDAYLNQLGLTAGSTVQIMFFNLGFMYLFLNWLCSLFMNNVPLHRDNLIVLVSDSKTAKILNGLNIQNYDINEYMQSWWDNGRIREEATEVFGGGSHSRLNIIAQAFANDVLQIDRTVILMDCDLIWKKDAFHEVEKIAAKENRDVVFFLDGRTEFAAKKDAEMPIHPEFGKYYRYPAEDEHGFQKYNTGFYLARPTKKGKEIFATALNLMPLMRWKRCDQPQWNSLLHNRRFLNLSIGIMPMTQYLPGGAWESSGKLKGNFKKDWKEFPSDIIAAHASDVASHTRKVTKLDAVGLWYLTKHCPYFRSCIQINPRQKYGCLPSNMDELLRNTSILDVTVATREQDADSIFALPTIPQ